jgi:hypothetical protein
MRFPLSRKRRKEHELYIESGFNALENYQLVTNTPQPLSIQYAARDKIETTFVLCLLTFKSYLKISSTSCPNGIRAYAI